MGSLIAVNDDAPTGQTYDSYIEHEVETSGVYLILFKEYNWNAGDYFVSTDCIAGSCEEVVCPQIRCAGCPTGTVYDENGCATCGCEESCPEAIQPPPYVRCAGIVTWAKSDTDQCCQYPSPCMVPPNMDAFDSELACEGPASDGEECSMHGRQCEEGLECNYQCPDGSNDTDCNLGINPSGSCVQGPEECIADADCMTTGCSGQVCAAQSVITTCQYEPEYICYNSPTTRCGCSNGVAAGTKPANLIPV